MVLINDWPEEGACAMCYGYEQYKMLEDSRRITRKATKTRKENIMTRKKEIKKDKEKKRATRKEADNLLHSAAQMQAETLETAA